MRTASFARIGRGARLLLLAAAGFGLSVLPATAREITDMLGRTVTIPDTVERAYASAPPAAMAIYTVAPERLVAFNFNLLPEQRMEFSRFLDKRTAGLPDLGSLMGHGRQADVERLIASHPDLVVAWSSNYTDTEKIEHQFHMLHIPVVFVRLDNLSDYPEAFALLGKLFGREERAKALSDYIAGALDRVNKALALVPPEKRRRVYYAEAPDGLATECDSSFHVEAIRMAGGVGVYSCTQSQIQGLERVSLEQVVSFAPDMIVSQDRTFAKTVLGDERWRNVKAVADGAVVAVPKVPFNWIDRPPSFMKALGVQWLAGKLYPDAFKVDIRAETKAFYRLFLNCEPSDEDLDLILG